MGYNTTTTIHETHPTQNLSTEEINDPYLVMADLFFLGHLPELREMLWNSFKATITGAYPKDLTKGERNNIVELYEHMQKLVEAVYLIYQKRN